MRLLGKFAIPLVLIGSAMAAPLGSSTRTIIPAQVQQVISVDYRALRNSESGMALKARVLPENLKQFEQALRGMSIDPDKDVEQLTFVAFRTKNGVRTVGVAQGATLDAKKFATRMKRKKIKPEKYRTSDIYSTGTGMVVNFLDPSAMLFGEASAVKAVLDTRDGESEGIAGNAQMNEMIADVESGPVWSVLDQAGTQNMMRSALGDAAKLADYDLIKKRMLGSRYTVDFSRGVAFNLNVVTSDTMTAATMSSLIKAGMMYKRMNATAAEKNALESMTVDSDSGRLTIQFKADDRKFQSLLQTDLFAAVSR